MNQHPDLFDEESLKLTKSFILGGIAHHHSSVAFETAEQWQLNDDEPTIRNILSGPVNFDEKAQAIAELRTRIEILSDPEEAARLRNAGFCGLGEGLSTDYNSCNYVSNEDGGRSFEEVSAFLKEMNLSPEELENFSRGFNGPDRRTDFTKWIQWMRENTGGDRIPFLEDQQSKAGGS